MKDREFLIWIHERLKNVHKESKFVDYMHKLRAVITSIPEDQETPTADAVVMKKCSICLKKVPIFKLIEFREWEDQDNGFWNVCCKKCYNQSS